MRIKLFSEKNIVLILGIFALSTLGFIVSDNNSEIIALAIVFGSLVCLIFALSFWKKHSTRRLFFLEDKKRNQLKKVSFIFTLCFCMLIPIFSGKLNVDFWIIAIMLIIILIVSILLFTKKALALDEDGIYYTFKRSIKWPNIIAYQVKSNGVLIIETKGGIQRMIKGVKSSDIIVIKSIMKKYDVGENKLSHPD